MKTRHIDDRIIEKYKLFYEKICNLPIVDGNLQTKIENVEFDGGYDYVL